jgi:hypothetical protein
MLTQGMKLLSQLGDIIYSSWTLGVGVWLDLSSAELLVTQPRLDASRLGYSIHTLYNGSLYKRFKGY